MKIKILLLLLFLILLSSCSNNTIEYNVEENISNFEVSFCPQDNCEENFLLYMDLARETINCAFYDLDSIQLKNKLSELSKNLEVEVIVDDEYLSELEGVSFRFYSDKNRNTKYNNYMHHKFCVIDNRYVITGSTNPSENGLNKNNNNLIFIESRYLSRNFNNEFTQLKNNDFGTNKVSKIEYNDITLNFKGEQIKINSYFCPQDDCEEEILGILSKANTEILFATFVITSDNIENILIQKSNNLEVKGIVEKRNMNSKGSIITQLNDSFPVYIDKNKNTMHHKFFVVDEKYVITGSMNPSSSGNNYNDENILIIENLRLAKLFKEEFISLIQINGT